MAPPSVENLDWRQGRGLRHDRHGSGRRMSEAKGEHRTRRKASGKTDRLRVVGEK
jgi:hypothetical protein